MRLSRLPPKPLPGMGLAWGHPLARGLVARFVFNEGAGTRLNNLAVPGGACDASVVNAAPSAWAGSARGGDFSFDGIDDGATFPLRGLHGAGAATCAVWFRTSIATLASTRNLFLAIGEPSLSGLGLSIVGSPASPPTSLSGNLFTTGSGPGVGNAAGLTIADGLLHHAVLVYDGANATLYYDGSSRLVSSGWAGTVVADEYLGRICHRRLAGVPGDWLQATIDDLRVYNRALSAGEVAALYREPHADAHRPLWLFPDRAHTTLEVEGYISGDWRNLTPDVRISPELHLEYGITGAGPTDQVASSGRMEFALANGANNSAGLLGRYSPGHVNCLPGFDAGIPIRFTYRAVSGTPYRKFYGWLDVVDPVAGLRGERITRCTVVDWMAEAADAKPTAVGTQVQQRADQIASTLLVATTRKPVSTSFDVGESVFPYALDNSRSDEDPVLTELQRLAQSERGYFYVKGDTAGGGRLCFESRSRRLQPTIVDTFSDDMVALSAPRDRSRVVNRVKVTIHPRRVDATNTVVLYQLPDDQGTPPLITPGQVYRITGNYNDPANRNARVGGIEMQLPVAGTDYDMRHNANGGGASMASSFAVVPVFGANSVDFVITSSAGKAGYLVTLQARGRGLYDYDAYDVVASNDASIEAQGEHILALDAPYLSDPLLAQAIAEYVLEQFAVPSASEVQCTVLGRSPALIERLMRIEVGDALSITESVTGVAQTYFVQHVSITFKTVNILTCEWILQRGPARTWWTLGVAGKSELGDTTYAAPL